jgi:hypothetical protein
MDTGHGHGDAHESVAHPPAASSEAPQTIWQKYAAWFVLPVVVLMVVAIIIIGYQRATMNGDGVPSSRGGAVQATVAAHQVSTWQRYEERDLQPEVVPAEEMILRAELFTPMRARPSITSGWTPWIELPAGTRFRRYNKIDGTGSVTVPYEVEVMEQYYEYGLRGRDPYEGPKGERRVRYRRLDFPGNAGFELMKYELVPYEWEPDGGPSTGKNAKGVHRVQ